MRFLDFLFQTGDKESADTAPSTPPGSEEEPGQRGNSDDDLHSENNSNAKPQDERVTRNEPQEEEPGRGTWLARIQAIRNLSGKIVNDSRVQFTIVLMIAANAIMLGVATFDFVTDDPEVQDKFELVDRIFLITFTVELAMQLFYHGFHLFLDGWLLFDFTIILLSWAFQEIQIIRSFRIFRALRLLTRIRVMKNLVTALFGVMPRMAAIFFLLFLIFYIFGVMMTQLFGDLYPNGETEINYFTRLDFSFFTLFQVMTLDAWGDVCRAVQETYSWAWLPFIAFVIISGFVVINLIIAVICDAIATLHADEKAMIHGMYHGGEDLSDEEVDLIDVKAQLEGVEGQVEDLTKMQTKTMQAIERLSRCLNKSSPAN